MTVYLSQRQRVELALPAALLHQVVFSLVREEVRDGVVAHMTDHPHAAALTSLEIAASEPLADLDAHTADKLMRRINRLKAKTLMPLRDRSMTTVYLAVVKLTQALVEDGILVPGEGPFRTVWDELADAVTKDSADRDRLDAVDRSAAKAARRLLAALREDGYYLPMASSSLIERS